MTHYLPSLIALAFGLAAFAASAYARRASRPSAPALRPSSKPHTAVCSLGRAIGSLDGEPIHEWIRLKIFDEQGFAGEIMLRYDGIADSAPRHHFTMDERHSARLIVGRVLYTSESRQI